MTDTDQMFEVPATRLREMTNQIAELAVVADRVRALDPETLARQFHEAYERLAPEFGYRTREASAKPWIEVPEDNRRLMIATCAVILGELVSTYETQEGTE